MQLHKLFRLSILLKALHGIFEIVLAGLLWLDFVSIVSAVRFLFRSELLEDPKDMLANYIITGLLHASVKGKLFATTYLLIHGMVNMGLAAALLSRRMWAFLSAGVVLSALFLYQVALLVIRPSIMLLAITAIDLAIILLLHSEYRRLSKKGKDKSARDRER
jgi:uncharacterized membrane protein